MPDQKLAHPTLKWMSLQDVPAELRELPVAERKATWAQEDLLFDNHWRVVHASTINASVVGSDVIGAQFDVRIFGVSAAINFTRNDYCCSVLISVDDVAIASSDLSAPFLDWVPTVLLISGLTDGSHEIRVKMVQTSNNSRKQCWVRSIFVPARSAVVQRFDRMIEGHDHGQIAADTCINVLSSRDRNVGDKHSSPVLNFAALRSVPQFDIFGWHPKAQRDAKMRAEFNRFLDSRNVIVGGGGLLETDYFQPALEYLRYACQKRVVLWGVGHNSPDPSTWHPRYNKYSFSIINYALVGVRDYGTRFEWVPCSSCMSPELEVGGLMEHEYGFVLHAVVKETINRITKQNPGAPIIDNFADFRSVINLIRGCGTIITNSFHGAYWATLMRRKVIALPTSSKFFSLRHPVVVATIDDWRAALPRAVVYDDALEECRYANMAFASKALDLLS